MQRSSGYRASGYRGIEGHTDRLENDSGIKSNKRANTINYDDLAKKPCNNRNKFDVDHTITGQAVGGPGKKSKVSMWDMMTLYDT